MAEEQGLAGRTWIGQPAIDYGAVPLHIGPSKVCMRQHARGIHVTISSASSTIAPHSIKASTLRVRRYRERRVITSGLRLTTSRAKSA